MHDLGEDLYSDLSKTLALNCVSELTVICAKTLKTMEG